MSCPNNSDGQHNYQLTTVPGDPPIAIKVCILCNQEG